MTHQIIVSREKRGLGHREAAAEIKKAVKMALAAEGITEPCLVSVCLTDDEGIRGVNREFRAIDRATDVLSFPFNELTPGAFDAAGSRWSAARRRARNSDTALSGRSNILPSIPSCICSDMTMWTREKKRGRCGKKKK